MNRPDTSHLPDKATTHSIRLAFHLAANCQLAAIQFRHLLHAQRQMLRLLHIVHIVSGSGHHIDPSFSGDFHGEGQIALQSVRRILDDRSAAPFMVQLYVSDDVLMSGRVSKAYVVAAAVRILAHEADRVQTDLVGGQELIEMGGRCTVEVVKVEREVLVRQGAAQFGHRNRSEN